MPMGDLIRRTAGRVPDKIAFIYDEQTITYREFNRRVNRLANAFLKMSLQKGDRVAVILHNSIEFYEVYLALAKIGGVIAPINSLYKERELKHALEYIKPRFLVFAAEFEPLLKKAGVEDIEIAAGICLGGSPSGEYHDYESLLAGSSVAEPEVNVTDDDIVSIYLTSGTTGKPKGAMRTHRHNFINAMTGAIELGVRPDDRVLLLFPFYHITFEDRFCHLLMGNTVVIRREGHFDPLDVLRLLSTHKVTICQFVPTMINSMLQEKRIEEYDLSAFRLLLYAAAPMPVELLKKALRRFHCGFMQFYGQTETGPITTVLRPEDHVLEGTERETAKLASAGRPVLTFEARIIDVDGNDAKVGEVGELAVRSESMTIGYWDLPEETAKTIRDGWLYTGDYARVDDEGYIYIVDRKNDMIISGGKNIYPREIEEVLYEHEAVGEVTVVGVPDDHWGESVKAVVVLKNGSSATEEELIAFCKANLASYKKPRMIEFRNELPKSPTGKILKRMIRDEYRQA